MVVILMFIGILLGLNCIPLLTKTTFPKAEKAIQILLVASALLFLTFSIFAFLGYRLKGIYTFNAISCAFIIAVVAYSALFKSTRKKIITVFLLTPLVVLSILTLKLGQLVYEYKIDESNKIAVTTGGFLACGEIIHISQTRLGIFDKDVHHIDNLCLIGINKIEIVELDTKQAEFLIYHNGENDSENPYRYVVQ